MTQIFLDNIVQLSDSPERKNGTRYTDADREAAYQCWRTFGCRSLRKVNEITGVAVSTLGTWSQSEGWVKRAAEDAKAERKSVQASIAAIVVDQRTKAVQRMIAIGEDPKTPPRDKIAGNIWLAAIGGLSPVHKSDVRFLDEAEEDDTPSRDALLALSPDELAERLARLRDEPVEDVG